MTEKQIREIEEIFSEFHITGPADLACALEDYNKQSNQMAGMIEKYEMPKNAVQKGADLFLCPECGRRVQVMYTHCNRCGKKLGWNRNARNRRGGYHA